MTKTVSKRGKNGTRATAVGRIPAALCALAAALTVALPGCKLTRAALRSQEPASKTVLLPRTVKGNFVMHYEALPGKRFPVHLTFQLDFNERSDGALFSTCVDSDGGLTKANATQKIAADKDVPLGLSGQSPDVAQGTQVLPLRCAKDEPFQARVQAAASLAASESSPPVPAANTAQGNTTQGNTTQGNTAQGNKTGNAPSNAAVSLAETQGTEAEGSFTFTSKPDAKGNVVRITLRPNDAGWQVENLSYYGLQGWVEGTDTLAMWGGGAK